MSAPVDQSALLALAQRILAQPTAPFHEAAVRRTLRELLAPLPHVSLEEDDFGNLIARYRRGEKPARWVFVAHMDHPGWVRPDGAPNGEWKFFGGVPEAIREKHRHLIRPFGADFAMWDLPECELRDGCIYTRACDDLIGCATIVATLQALEAAGIEADVYGLFTRAEEVGFVGALHVARSGRWQERGLTFISLETSSARPPAVIGDGPIVRVGDKTSLFDKAATEEMLEIAAQSGLAVQRCLMSGGTCEASAFQLYGLQSAALCVALGNYHNITPEQGIGPEYISLADFAGLVQLCREIASQTEPAGRYRVPEALRQRLEKETEPYAPYHGRDR
ncbi:MAG: M20/M25/M40 family metallo-hydrolase [Verrucomicrobia bacterium]|nr:M20/M25/M40 family metallo-hydrolase [Verrucomicrobiota bacterium]